MQRNRNTASRAARLHFSAQAEWLAYCSRGFVAASLLAVLLLTSGCLVQSKIQGRYVEDQGECRSTAEGDIDRYRTASITSKDRNAQLLTLFSECMAKQGWQVAKPKPTTNGPHGPLDPYGRAAATAAKTGAQPQQQRQQLTPQQQQQQLFEQQQRAPHYYQPEPTQQPEATVQPAQTQQPEMTKQPLATQQPSPAQQPVETQTMPLSPSGGTPPLSQPVDAPARYQPARPGAVLPDESSYGTGAGRNF